MVDVVSKETRSRMMSGIRGKDTGPEMSLRRGMHRLGFRFRLYVKDLPGKPDLVFPRYRAVIFVHGCFWHGHTCKLFRLPATRTEFWREKIERNRARDSKALAGLMDGGWRVAVVWECALRGRDAAGVDAVCDVLGKWLSGDDDALEVSS